MNKNTQRNLLDFPRKIYTSEKTELQKKGNYKQYFCPKCNEIKLTKTEKIQNGKTVYICESCKYKHVV